MRRFHYMFAVGTVIACLFGTHAYSQSEGSAEMRKKEAHKTLTERDKKIHELAIREGIEDEEARRKMAAAQGIFQGTPGHGSRTPHKERVAGTFEQKRDPSAKIDLTGNGQTSKQPLFKSLRQSAPKSSPSDRSAGQQGLQHQKTVAKDKDRPQELAGEHSEKPDAHHHHHHQQQSPDTCDSAGSPSDVASCKEAREELRGPK
jgi:hypothetical protein